MRIPAAGAKGAPKNPGELKDDTSASREEKLVIRQTAKIHASFETFLLILVGFMSTFDADCYACIVERSIQRLSCVVVSFRLQVWWHCHVYQKASSAQKGFFLLGSNR